MKSLFAATLLLVFASVLVAEDVPTTARPVLEASTRVLKVVGAELAPLGEKESVLPGDILLYEITYTNRGKMDAVDVQFVYPVPEGMVYQEGSAKCEDCVVQFSLDGQAFSVPPVKYTETVNGKPVEKVATPSQYRLIEWLMKKPIAMGGEAVVSFKVTVDKISVDKDEKGGSK